MCSNCARWCSRRSSWRRHSNSRVRSSSRIQRRSRRSNCSKLEQQVQQRLTQMAQRADHRAGGAVPEGQPRQAFVLDIETD